MKLSEIKPGDILTADGGFTCLKEGETRIVKTDTKTGELYIQCSATRHYLDGQVDDQDNIVGLSKAE